MDRLEDNRSNAILRCPLDGSQFAKSKFENAVCLTCQLCRLGKDALGLNILLEAEELPKTETANFGDLKEEIDLTMPSFL